MASLALMVSMLFLATLFLGPVSLIFSFLGMNRSSLLTGLMALILGTIWCIYMPFPVSLAGGLCAISGAAALSKF